MALCDTATMLLVSTGGIVDNLLIWLSAGL